MLLIFFLSIYFQQLKIFFLGTRWVWLLFSLLHNCNPTSAYLHNPWKLVYSIDGCQSHEKDVRNWMLIPTRTSKTPRHRPSFPMTPASSATSRMAVTLGSSSGSTPPPGTIHWSGRLDDVTNKTCKKNDKKLSNDVLMICYGMFMNEYQSKSVKN